MKWIKASERLPEKKGEYVIRMERKKSFPKQGFSKDVANYFPKSGWQDVVEGWEVIEWLDESASEVVPDPVLNFDPIFYIIDIGLKRVLAAEKQDRQEVIGIYIKFNQEKKEWVMTPANLNSQSPWEYPTRFLVINDWKEAIALAGVISLNPAHTEEWCQLNFPRSEDFPKY